MTKELGRVVINADDPCLGLHDTDNVNVSLIEQRGVGDYTVHWGRKTFKNSIARAFNWLKRWER